jgi:ABC-type sugar transport system, periplasmic component
MYFGKKVSLALLIVVLLLSSVLASCSTKEGGNTAGNGSTSTETETNQGQSQGKSDEPVEITMFVDATWYPFNDWSGEIPELITKATGVKPKVTVATESNQLPLMVSSGDLPDLVVSFNFNLMSNSNVSLPYNEIFPKYAPEVKFDPIREFVNTVSDGNYYAIRNDFSTEKEWKANPHAHMMVPGLAMRKDILEELGNPEIKSLSDLDKVFAMVKAKYPNMTPLILNPFWQRQFFDAQFGAGGGFVDQDGKLVYYLRQPELLQSVLYMNSLYRNGFITSENFAYTNESQTEEMMLAEKGFAYTWTYSGADRMNANAAAQGKPFRFIQLAEPLSPDATIFSTGVGGLGMYVTKSNRNVEATVRFLAYLFSEEGWRLAQWGVEGKDWTWNEAGYPEFTYDVNDVNVLKQKGVYWWGVPTETGVGMALSAYKPGSETTRQGEHYSKIIKFNPVIGLIVPEIDSQEQIIKANIDTMVETEIIKVYLAETEEEARKAFDELIRKAEEIGMSKLEDWANSIYPELKEQYDRLVNQ